MDPRPHAQTPINGKWTDGDGTSGGELPPSVLPAANATVEHGDSEDELDDLDDMLDEFDDGSSTVALGNGAPVKLKETVDEDWAQMLQEGMADLLSDGNESVRRYLMLLFRALGAPDADGQNNQSEMQTQFEKLAKELNEALAATDTPATASPSAPSISPDKAPDASPANFQDRIKQTMERMKLSNAEVDAGLSGADSDDFLAEMMKQMGGSGEGKEEDFSSMLVNMMEQLTSKEILYEPLKDLYEKYPEWIRENEDKESKENMNRYREQYNIVKEIVMKFDEAGYRDEDETHREYIIDRMQKMQSAGAPPAELMGDMNQEIDPPDIDSTCGVQ